MLNFSALLERQDYKIKPHWLNQWMQSGPHRSELQPARRPPYYTPKKHSSFGSKYRLGITSLQAEVIYKPTS